MLILGSGLMRKRGSLETQQIYANGDNSLYQLGVGDTIDRSSPVAVSSIGGTPRSWATISAGVGHVLALTSDGQMYVWGGDNLYGQWGNNNNDSPTGSMYARNRSSPTIFPTTGKWTTVQTGGFAGISIDEITLESISTFNKIYLGGVKTDGTLWTWGSNRHGALGTGDSVTDGSFRRSSPTQVGADNDWVDVAVGGYHMLGLKSDGTVYAWGLGADGILATSATTTVNVPTLTTSVGATFAKVYAAGKKSFAIDTAGQLYFAGKYNAYPSVGNVNRSLFTAVSGASNITLAALGPVHGLLIKSDGTLHAAGDNAYGQLGNSSTVDRSGFAQVGAATNWTKARVSINHSLALRSNGDLYAWGRNNVGQLGNNSTVNVSSPVLVATGVADIGAALYTSFWLKTDGTLWAVGSRNDGAATADAGLLGDSLYREEFDLPSINRSSPIQIGSGLNYSNFSFDSDYNFAGVGKFIYENDLYMWGPNGGYLNVPGDGSAGNEMIWLKTLPGQWRKFPHSWNAVAAGVYHCAAIKSDGTLWTWGLGAGGALGNGLTTNRSSPIQVGTDNDWVAVSAGSSFTMGLKSVEGAGYSLYAWGSNNSGRLGNNSTVNVSTPVNVPSKTSGGVTLGWLKVKCGGFFAYALDSDGDIYAWGQNNAGQLGFGNTTSVSSPVLAVNAAGVNSVLAASLATNYGHYINGTTRKLYSAGINTYGGLGDSTTTTKSLFTVIGTSSWSFVSAGYNHSAGVTSNGRYFAWGRNLTGQIGGLNPSVDIYKNSPTQVGTRSSWTIVEAGGTSATDGTTWAVSKESL